MVTPAGPISETIVAVRRAVAGSTTFQAAVGAGDVDAALALVALQHWTVEELPAADHHLPRPFAIVDYPQLRMRTEGDQCLFVTDAQLSIYYTMDQTPGDTHEDGYVTFANFAGQSVYEAFDGGGFEGAVAVQSVSTLIAPRRVARAERTPDHDFWEAAFSLTLDT